MSNINTLHIIGTDRNSKRVITATQEEIINNALNQEEQGIEPHYAWIDYQTRKPLTPLGWLVWSTWDHGCGIVYRREDGKMIITTGVQGDFGYFYGGQVI